MSMQSVQAYPLSTFMILCGKAPVIFNINTTEKNVLKNDYFFGKSKIIEMGFRLILSGFLSIESENPIFLEGISPGFEVLKISFHSLLIALIIDTKKEVSCRI